MTNPLTNNEFRVLQLLWKEGRSLSRPEIIEKTPEREWNPNSIHLILNNMIEKGVLCVDGLTRCGKGYGRTYGPTMTQMEYAAYQVVEATPDCTTTERILGIVSAMIDRGGIDLETIDKLREILKEKKKELELK